MADLHSRSLLDLGPPDLRAHLVQGKKDRLRLVANPEYWDAGALAFRTIDVLAVDHLGTALNLYLAG